MACEWAGIETVAFCEREPFPQQLLKKHWPHVPIYDDVCTLTKERLEEDGIGTIDLIHGGYPCQPFSHAGKRKGKEDDRHLWPEVRRLIEAIRPRWFVGENVAGHVTLGLDDVLSDLGDLGYTAQSFIIPACAVNAPHRRDRVFIVAHADKQHDDNGGYGASEVFRFGPASTFISRSEENVADTKSKRCGEAREHQSERTEERTPGYGEVVSDTSSEGLPIRRRSERPTSSTETGTGMESQSERRGAYVADANSQPRLETGSTSGTFGSGWEPRDNASWSSGEYVTGTDWWSTEPDVGRVANGVPNRVDRLKALGNAVVPQQIYPILAAIKQIDDLMRVASSNRPNPLNKVEAEQDHLPREDR